MVRVNVERLQFAGRRRAVVVAAPADTTPLQRLQGAAYATRIAESFRDAGRNVLLIMDSLTRYAMAQREIGLATGEPPTTKGYTPSVFAMLPRLMERAGTSETGSITAIYTVLVDGGDMDEPIADAARGILDGHMVLSRDIAAKNHYPCIDIGHSVSLSQHSSSRLLQDLDMSNSQPLRLVIVAPDSLTPDPDDTDALAEAFTRGGLVARSVPNIMQVLWEKLMQIGTTICDTIEM